MSNSVQVITKLPAALNKLAKVYRSEILEGFSESLDEIRRVAALRYIIPDKHPNKSISQKYRLQPTDPVKLTSRTGALKKMLLMGVGKWQKGTSTLKSDSAAVQATVKTISKNTYHEEYEGTIGYVIKDPSKISSKRTIEQLKARFYRWDHPGNKRPFLQPAAKDVGMKGVENSVKKRLRAIGVL